MPFLAQCSFGFQFWAEKLDEPVIYCTDLYFCGLLKNKTLYSSFSWFYLRRLHTVCSHIPLGPQMIVYVFFLHRKTH